MTEPLADVLDRYFASRNQQPVRADSDGVFTIDAGDGLVVGATTLDDGRMELYSNPGYVSAATLRAIVEDDDEDAFDDFDDTAAVPGALMRWQADEVEWFIDVDRTTGRVTLSGVTAQPWHPEGFAAAVETFRGVHATWVARLEVEPPEVEHSPGTMEPNGVGHQGFMLV